MSQWKRGPASWRSLSFRKKVREKRKPTKANYKVESKEHTIRKDGERSQGGPERAKRLPKRSTAAGKARKWDGTEGFSLLLYPHLVLLRAESVQSWQTAVPRSAVEPWAE